MSRPDDGSEPVATTRPAWSPSRTGPRPSLLVAGGDDPDPVAIALDMTPWWAERIATLPDGPFPAPPWLRTTRLDSAIRRGWIERRGLDGRTWTYALTHLGRAIAKTLRTSSTTEGRTGPQNADDEGRNDRDHAAAS